MEISLFGSSDSSAPPFENGNSNPWTKVPTADTVNDEVKEKNIDGMEYFFQPGDSKVIFEKVSKANQFLQKNFGKVPLQTTKTNFGKSLINQKKVEVKNC